MDAEKRANLIAEGRDPDVVVEDDTSAFAGTFLIATVKGDVHDIGKNIVSAAITTRFINLDVMEFILD
jgi:5-methyltetrahydrofolate--homocysteine methyltransferase